MKHLYLFILAYFFTLSPYAQNIRTVGDTLPWDTLTFEKSYEFLDLSTNPQSIWQIGKPQKVFFDTSYSAINAIVTDTTINYPVNNYSYFDIKIGEFNYDYYYGWYVGMQFKHKFHTDTLLDGGFITVSYDYGLTWTNIINDSSVYYDFHPGEDSWSSISLYTTNDTLFNGEYGFSGKSDGWQTTFFSWFYIPVKGYNNFPDTTIIRFNFISDDTDSNMEGWMIDDIQLCSVDLGSKINVNNKSHFNIYPVPMYKSSTVDLKKEFPFVHYQLFDSKGTLVNKHSFFKCKSFVLQKNYLDPGIYILKIMTDDGVIGIRKLIIK